MDYSVMDMNLLKLIYNIKKKQLILILIYIYIYPTVIINNKN